MPRLVGRQSYTGSYVISFLMLFVVSGGLLQYLGVIDISSLSKETLNLFKTSERIDQTVVALLTNQEIESQESANA